MSNEIVQHQEVQHVHAIEVYDRIPNPMEAIKVLGAAIFKSGMFGCDRPEQGEVLAMQCLAERKSPLELARTYHFINGQLAVRADALLAKFQNMGGRVEWKERTDTRVVATFCKAGQSGVEIVADIEEYKRNGVAFKADGRTMKENWNKWPRRMLTARAISEGVRLVAPECCFGTYTVEEVDGGWNKPASRKVESVHDVISEIVPKDKEEQAKEIFVKMGLINDTQTIYDVDPASISVIKVQKQAIKNLLIS